MDNWFREPITKQPIYVNDDYKIDWRGTIGVGDILYGMNCAYALSHLHDHSIHMRVHWQHSEDYLYHFEDPETVVERGDYFHKFYYQHERVSIEHIFNSEDPEIEGLRWKGFGHKDRKHQALTFHHWFFDKKYWLPPTRKKVVFWRPMFNREIPSGGKSWKMSFTLSDWEKILIVLRGQGYDLVELTYRTPASEAFYHIRTCAFCIFYDGMWQYLARNLAKPVITLGKNGVCQLHSPQSVHFREPDKEFWDYLYKLPRNEAHLRSRANRYRKKVVGKIDDFYD